MVRTGMRLSEQAHLTRPEVPAGPGAGGYQRFWLPGATGFPVGFAAAGVSLEWAPLAYFCIRVLDADPPGGLTALVLAPAVVLGEGPLGRVFQPDYVRTRGTVMVRCWSVVGRAVARAFIRAARWPITRLVSSSSHSAVPSGGRRISSLAGGLSPR